MRQVTVRKIWMLAFLMAGFVPGCGREQATFGGHGDDPHRNLDESSERRNHCAHKPEDYRNL